MRALPVLLFAFAAAGCTVSFDPDGQPCDALGHCLSGYVCQGNVCHPGASGSGSTGHASTSSSSGSSGTHGSTGGGSTTGTATSGSTGTTGSTRTCADLLCSATESCVMEAGTPTCQVRTANDAICTSNLDCGTGICLRPPDVGTGVCAESCDAGCPPGATCDALLGSRGNAFWACLDSPAPTPCTGTASSDCANPLGGTLACLPFTGTPQGAAPNPLVDQLPLLFCDTPLAGSSVAGDACSSSSDCQSGLCAEADSTGGVGVCIDLCLSAADCDSQHLCEAVSEIGSLTHFLGCGPRTASGCALCGSCGPDAPDCIIDSVTGGQICVLSCDSSEASVCGTGRACQQGSGGSYCAVNGGVCP